ncbi:hypothetical protein [Brevundimonas viscosa]|uniref:Uncharacterized protein n=1 Tax=Brevundimonas viscosa TaxID=871741 RepID=A0A1I6TCV9_9CAUL|nr:hypothetical protein [Brevundimonas viscosa]SFS86993.1 hypothetical protein SAMN05192570_3132 [Brevundimonas viscosa]
MTHTPPPAASAEADHPRHPARSEAESRDDPLVALAAGLVAQGGSDAVVGVRALLRHVQTHHPAALERMVAELHLQRLRRAA